MPMSRARVVAARRALSTAARARSLEARWASRGEVDEAEKEEWEGRFSILAVVLRIFWGEVLVGALLVEVWVWWEGGGGDCKRQGRKEPAC